MFRVLLFIFLSFPTLGHSEESSPRPSEHGAKQAAQQDQSANTFERPPAPFPYWFLDKPVPPVINVFTSKHAGEHEQCAKPKNWKEWPAFSWCKVDAWLDAERVIALFTVILGVATWLLWRATDKLVRGADNTAQRQLRAYLSVRKSRLRNLGVDQTPQAHIVIRNSGQTPAYNARAWIGAAFLKFPPEELPPHPDEQANWSTSTVGADGEMHLTSDLGGPLTAARCKALEDGSFAIFVTGGVRYKDAFGVDRQTTFRKYYGGTSKLNAKGVLYDWNEGNAAD